MGDGEILIVAEAQARAEALRDELAFLARPTRVAEPEEDFRGCGLFVWQGDPDRGGPGAQIERLAADARAVLILPRLNPRWIAHYLRYPQVGAFLAEPADELGTLLEQVLAGSIADLSLLLPGDCVVQSHDVSSYEDRCDVLEHVVEHVKANKLRGKQRRSAELVTEELLMNAMYHAPVDERGVREFAGVEPRDRIAARTPRPANVRFAIHDGAVYIAVRDNFGSFQREDLATYLLRGAAKEQIDEKKAGAGLGLFQIASTATRFYINIAPGKRSDFVCVLDPPEKKRRALLRVMAVVSGPPAMAAKQRTSMNLSSVLAELRQLVDEAATAGGGDDAPGQDTVVDWPVSGSVSGSVSRNTMVDWPPVETPSPDEIAPSDDREMVQMEITAELPEESLWRSTSTKAVEAGDEEDETSEGTTDPGLGPPPIEEVARPDPGQEPAEEPEPESMRAEEVEPAEDPEPESMRAEEVEPAAPAEDRIAALWDTAGRGSTGGSDKGVVADLFSPRAKSDRRRSGAGVDVFALYSSRGRGASSSEEASANGEEDRGTSGDSGGKRSPFD